MVYVFDELNKIDDEILNSIYKYMPQERKEKFQRYKFRKDKVLCAMAYLLLCYGLDINDQFNFNQMQFTYNEQGKPSFSDKKMPHFNMSHCDIAVACGISDSNIGVDIQDKIECDRLLLEEVMSIGEINTISNSLQRELKFGRFWSCKESYLKFDGTGLVDDLNQIDFSKELSNRFVWNDCVFEVEEFNDYCVSVCSKNSEKIIHLTFEIVKEFADTMVVKHERG